ncbi:hypothetical protein HNQ08_002728 [Deinococcus humi]|uniref:Uncharacterized protein n=1 Tax=Deinococcus humi TaxID=662880 RepID=A0A7W8JUP8_9DEIO|nr:hypothetical protein [Deinococcus humi]
MPEELCRSLVASVKDSGDGCSGMVVKVRDSGVEREEFLRSSPSFEAELAPFVSLCPAM